jgi:two-component system, OmpR family, alkaline phosphatase synthesis response regulator PhoP
MTNDRILLVDDEPAILDLLKMYLKREGFILESAGDGEAALELYERFHPNMVILDLMLPVLDGYEVCRKIRSKDTHTAIMMLTARDEDIDKIIGLELGADDYVTKPFNPRELVARTKAILRRSERAVETDQRPIHIDNLMIDRDRRKVTIDDTEVSLRTQQFNLLEALAENLGRVLTREQLLEMAWGIDFYGQTRTVDVHIAHLRKLLADSNMKIETVSGVGYRMVP